MLFGYNPALLKWITRTRRTELEERFCPREREYGAATPNHHSAISDDFFLCVHVVCEIRFRVPTSHPSASDNVNTRAHCSACTCRHPGPNRCVSTRPPAVPSCSTSTIQSTTTPTLPVSTDLGHHLQCNVMRDVDRIFTVSPPETFSSRSGFNSNSIQPNSPPRPPPPCLSGHDQSSIFSGRQTVSPR